jgi:hypothetical protein
MLDLYRRSIQTKNTITKIKIKKEIKYKYCKIIIISIKNIVNNIFFLIFNIKIKKK